MNNYLLILAEDEAPSLRKLERTIETLGNNRIKTVGSARNGQTAAELFFKNRADILISDIKMPVLDGLDLVCTIKSHNPFAKTAFVSGFGDFELVREALRRGVNEYLTKPLQKDELEDFIDSAVVELDMEYDRQYSDYLADFNKKDRKRFAGFEFYSQYCSAVIEVKEELKFYFTDLLKERLSQPCWVQRLSEHPQQFGVIMESTNDQLKSLTEFLNTRLPGEHTALFTENLECFSLAVDRLLNLKEKLDVFFRAKKVGLFGIPEDIGEVTNEYASIVFEAIAYLQENYAKDLSMAKLARILGISATYLSTVFKKQTGLSPIEMLTQIRMENVILQLRKNPEIALKNVALNVGIADSHYFSRLFYKYTKISPSDYKKMLKQEVNKNEQQ